MWRLGALVHARLLVRGAALLELALLDVVDVDDLLVLVVRLLDRAEDEEREWEGEEHHAPAREVLVQQWREHRVHAEGARAACTLHSLVQTGVPGEREGVVGERAHDPVREGLVACVAEVVCEVGLAPEQGKQDPPGTYRRRTEHPCPCSRCRGS